jgi:putative oxidoreductase
MNAVQGLLSLVGRVMLASIFLIALRHHFVDFDRINQLLADKHIPAPKVANVLAIAFMAIGGLSIVLGFKARIGALLLFVFLGLAGYYIHDFWHLSAGLDREDALVQFLKNMALMGAMLFIVANGPGAWSLDYCLAKTPPPGD